MKSYPIWKPIVVLAVLAAAALLIYPPSIKLKPGLDLAGGTTLVYDVRVPEDATNPGQVIDDVIAILRDRVDPTGTRNLVWRRQAGNRIEIQMALATAETGERRAAYERELEAFLSRNIDPEALDAALRLPPEERSPRLEAMAGDATQNFEALQELAMAYDALQAINEPYREALERHREAERRLEALETDAVVTIDQRLEAQEAAEEAFARLGPLAADVADARAAYQPLREAVLEQNVEAFELEAIFDLSKTPELGQQVSPRERALEELKQEHPDRAAGIEAVAEAWESYEQVKGPLDDPNDLIALLQSSGVLEFRIAPTPDEPVNFDRYRERLEESGPRAGLDEPYRWFEIDSLQRYIDDPDHREAVRENPEVALANLRGVVGAEYRGKFYVLLANTPDKAMTSEEEWRLADAYRSVDELGRPAVGFDMDPRGSNALSRITRNHIGDPMAILLDGGVITTPTLQAALSTGGIITGNFNAEYVDFLVRTLDSGSLDAQLGDYPILIKTTGPQLGADNLEAGLTAAITALILVAIFMVFYYFFAGLVATIALGANMLIILGLMAMVQATFTLPGIAGIVLTIGMAVDANVLIFERIREELNNKADLATAVRLGFDKALSTIVDANLTTFITALVLFYTATAEIKGFATTLMCGILATLFTSLILSRILVDGYVRLLKGKQLPMLPTVVPALGRALEPNVNWVGKRYGFFVVSVIVMGAGLGMVFARGTEMLDIEFRSGTQVSFEVDYDLEGRAVTPPEAVGVTVEAEAPLVPIDEVRERLSLAAAASAGPGAEFPDDVESTPARRAAFERLVAVAENYDRRFNDELATFAETGDPEDDPGERQDMAQLADAQVVTQGTSAGRFASGFSLATLVTDAQLVSDVVKAAFSDLIDEPPRVSFAGIQRESHLRGPVYPLVETNDEGDLLLGRSINRLDVATPVDEYRGGVAVVMEDIQPTIAIDELEERMTRIRRQPPFDEQGYRKFDVIGIDPAGTDESGRPLYATAVVISTDETTNYAENPAAFERGDGLAAMEWEVVRQAAQRDASLQSVASFSSQVSGTMRQRAIVAMCLSLLAVVAYIWFRFGSIRYGLAAIAALVHDVSIALGLLAISGWLYDNAIGHALLLTDFKIDLAIVAAMLTIVGYSLNDTIVVFDRIRENRGKLAHATPAIVNTSINQTISRTVLTSGTTLLAVGTLYFFGGPGVHGFAFAMIIGVLVGTYSSIAVASPALLVGVKERAAAKGREDADDRAPAPAPAT